MNQLHRGLLLGSTALLLAQAGAAFAQTAEPVGVHEVIVTAQKRSERLQDVPIAITAMDERRLEAAQVIRSQDIVTLVPGLQPAVGASPRNFFLRGVGISTSTPGQDSPVATYVDDVYVASPVAATLLINSVERIEVLKGPQGTLFGRNATAGVVSYHTKDPSFEAGLAADVGYASYDTISGRVYATAPLGERVAVNLAVAQEEQREGWGYNFTLGREFRTIRNTAVRGKLLWTPASGTEVLVGAWRDSTRTEQNVAGSNPGIPAVAGYVNTHGVHDFDGNFPSFTKNESEGGFLRFDQDLGWAQLVNIVAYQNVKPLVHLDQDGSPADLQRLVQRWRQRTWTEELQLVSNSGPEDFLQWAAGLYLLKDDILGYRLNVQGSRVAAGQRVASEMQTQSWAPFVQATLRLLPTTRLTLGARYTTDKREYRGQSGTNVNPAVLTEDTSSTYRSPSYRLSLDHDFSPDVMGYVSYNRGFKAGTYNMQVISDPPRPLKPETLDAYEVGLKSTLFDRMATVNVAAFYYDYKNITVRAPLNNTTTFDIQNAATARLYGLDLDFVLQPTPELTITGGLELLNATFREFASTTAVQILPTGGFRTITINPSGNRLPFAPKVSGNIGVSYRLDLADRGALQFAGDVMYRSTSYFEADNIRVQGPLTLLNASVKWTPPGERWDVIVWGRNLTDEVYKAGHVGNVLADTVLYGAPRTIGVTLSFHLGNS